MITKWEYTDDRDGYRQKTKKLIKDNGYNSVDIGAGMDYWSYPECKNSIDFLEITKEDNVHYRVDLDKISKSDLVFHKYDFSICSHTLEDIFNPFDVIDFLEKISHRGLIAIPSKFYEFSFLYENKYRGNAHHKQLFDIIDNKLVLFPKYPFIEVMEETNSIRDMKRGNDLYFYWEGNIPKKYFNEGFVFKSDAQVINTFYNELRKS
jgi:hypothetical protein